MAEAIHKKDKVRMTRLLRLRKKDRSFDLEFWQKVGAAGRIAAAWEMVCEVAAIRGIDADQPRLQRTVERLQRRAG